nr:hypothetical protein [Tanacetum cinerariifolium]
MNSKAYKEYYAIATGETAPKPKAGVKRTRISSDTSITPPTAAASLRLTSSTKGKQTTKESKAKSLSALSEQVAMDKALVPTAQRLKIGRSNFRLLSDIKSKESTLQLVYDATTTVDHHAIRFKMDNKKHIVNLESFKDMLHISPRVHGQSFAETPFEEEILTFIHFLGHSAAIRMLTDVNINKLYQPWRYFVAIINKCLTGKSSGYDSVRLSQAQILWGLYHKRNVDYAYLMWEDFVYQVKHKNQKKSNEMYYPRFTKVIIHHFMSKDPLIPRRNKVNWHYIRDDHMNSKAYKEYYAIATGETAPNPKAGVKRTKSSSDTSITPPTATASLRLTSFTKGKQTAKSSKAKSADEGTGSKPGAPDVPTDESEEELSWNSTNDEGDDNEEKDYDGDEEDEGDDGEEGNGDDDDDDREEGDGNDDDQGVVRDDDKDDEMDDEEEGRDDEHKYDDDESDEEIKDELRSLETNFSEAMQTNQFAGAVSAIPRIVQRYMDQQMNEAVKVVVQIQSDHLHDEAQRENDEFLKTVDENMQKIIKEKVKEQVKVQVSDLSEMELKKILIEKMEGNKSIQRSEEQRNLYKALVEAYKADKAILDTYGSIFETTSQTDAQTLTSVAPLPMTVPTMTPSTIATTIITSQAPILPTTASSTII